MRAPRVCVRAALLSCVRAVLLAARRALRRHALPASRARRAAGPSARAAPPPLALAAAGHLGDVGAPSLQPRRPAGCAHAHHAAPGHLIHISPSTNTTELQRRMPVTCVCYVTRQPLANLTLANDLFIYHLRTTKYVGL